MSVLNQLPDLTAVYYGAVRSILEYAAPSFGKLPEYLCRHLDRVQKRCHRLICGIQHTSECPCERFPSFSNRRNKMALNLYLSASQNKEHILHSIIPAKSSRSTRPLQPPSSTTRLSHSFINYTTKMLLGGLDV